MHFGLAAFTLVAVNQTVGETALELFSRLFPGVCTPAPAPPGQMLHVLPVLLEPRQAAQGGISVGGTGK